MKDLIHSGAPHLSMETNWHDWEHVCIFCCSWCFPAIIMGRSVSEAVLQLTGRELSQGIFTCCWNSSNPQWFYGTSVYLFDGEELRPYPLKKYLSFICSFIFFSRNIYCESADARQYLHSRCWGYKGGHMALIPAFYSLKSSEEATNAAA